jgi:MFS family permease
MVFAFGQGGAAAVGIISLVQLIPAAIIAPLGSVLGDRFPREKVFMLAEASMSVACVLAAAAALLDAPAIVIYAAACSVGWLLTLVRPTHGALLPWLARDPTELTTAYTAAGLIESSCVLLGPLLASGSCTRRSPYCSASAPCCCLASTARRRHRTRSNGPPRG